MLGKKNINKQFLKKESKGERKDHACWCLSSLSSFHQEETNSHSPCSGERDCQKSLQGDGPFNYFLFCCQTQISVRVHRINMHKTSNDSI